MQAAIDQILKGHGKVAGVSVAMVQDGKNITTYSSGKARVTPNEPMTADHFLQCASLSKTVATAFAIEYFANRGIYMNTSVNQLLSTIPQAIWRIQVAPTSTLAPHLANEVTLAMLVNHTALGMHYVYGIPMDKYNPTSLELLDGSAANYKYDTLYLERTPGQTFSYSGGGFVVLQYLIETIEQKDISEVTRAFLDECDLQEFTFTQLSGPLTARYAYGHITPAQEVNPPLIFPPFAAGALCTPRALLRFLMHLGDAFQHRDEQSKYGGISPQTAQIMLGKQSLLDLGAMNFMGAYIGLGVFVAHAGEYNQIMMHQAANDGYRGVYMYCFDGPDAGKGFLILLNGDNPGVLFQCELCRHFLGPSGNLHLHTVSSFSLMFVASMLIGLHMEGIDHTKYHKSDLSFDMSTVKQESIVNKGIIIYCFSCSL